MKMNKSMAASLVALMTTGVSFGAASVSWLSPPNNASFTAGTLVQPNGAAAGTGTVGGGGLDLTLVLDDSGSMRNSVGGKSLVQWQREAATALVNSLPAATSSVAVVEFGTGSSTRIGLTPVSTGSSAIINAINGVNGNQGNTNIISGVNRASNILTNPPADPNRTQMMVVISDGGGSNPTQATDAAIVAGVEQIHAVGIPSHNPFTMRAIVDGADDIFGNADDHGTYTAFNNASDLNSLISIFNGTGGNLVGLQQVDITLPDGTVLANVPTDGVGNFTVPGSGYALALGPNVFTATATATDGSVASQTLTLIGTAPTGTGVPDGGATLTLLGLALAGLSLAKKTKRA